MRLEAKKAAQDRENSESKNNSEAKNSESKEEGDLYIPQFTYSSAPTQRTGMKMSFNDDIDDDNDVLSVASEEAPNNVAVSVLETVLGVSHGDNLEESCYVVEYDSD